MVFKGRRSVYAYGDTGEYLLQFRDGQLLEATLKSHQMEFLLGDTVGKKSLTLGEHKGSFTLKAGKSLRLDPTQPLDLDLILGEQHKALGPFRKAVLEIAKPLRTPSNSAFVAEMRMTGEDFDGRTFTAFAAMREGEAAGEFYEIRELEVETAKQGSARLKLRLPEQFSDAPGFKLERFGIPIDLRVISAKEDGDFLVAESIYYVGSVLGSSIITLLVLLVCYFGPLWFLRLQREPSKRKDLGFGLAGFRIYHNPTPKTLLWEESGILPMKAVQPGWFSPLWLGRNRRGEARMSSFQITVWTYLVFSVAVYVLLMNGQMIDINQGVLYLLGISGGGSLLARVAAARQAQRVEIVTGAGGEETARERLIPAWSQLIMSGGRVDLSRLQILLFTLLTAFYVGITAMVTFQFPEVPEGLLTLMGISNGLYVLGKVTEPGLADHLAKSDLYRRAAKKEQEVEEGRKERITNLITEKKKRLQDLAAEIKAAQDDKKSVLKTEKGQLESELGKLKEDLAAVEKSIEQAKTAVEEKEKAYKEILVKLNQALDKQSDTVV